MDNLQLTGWNMGRVFHSRSGCMCTKHLCCYEAKQPNLKLKTWPKQPLGSLALAFALPIWAHSSTSLLSTPGAGTIEHYRFVIYENLTDFIANNCLLFLVTSTLAYINIIAYQGNFSVTNVSLYCNSISDESNMLYNIDTKGLFHKTYYGRNLRFL